MLILCQHASASCGACCGLYNRADLSREATTAELRKNTALLSEAPRTEEAYRAAVARRSRELPTPLFPSVRTCPLLGFLDADETRVGCLAHPAITGGPDLRACGVYDALTCDAFLCPSHAYLSEEEAGFAATAAGDFFLYGLVVTDAPFLQAVLDGIAARTGARPRAPQLAHPPFRRAFEHLLALKEDLVPGSDGHFGAFRKRPSVGTARSASPVERLVEALGGDTRSGNDPDALEQEVRLRLEACVRSLPPAPPATGRAGR